MLALCRAPGRVPGPAGAAKAVGRVLVVGTNVVGFVPVAVRYAVRYARLAIFRYGLRWFFDAVRAVLPRRLHAWLRGALIERR
jgi:hypothetical protein